MLASFLVLCLDVEARHFAEDVAEPVQLDHTNGEATQILERGDEVRKQTKIGICCKGMRDNVAESNGKWRDRGFQ